MDKRIWLQQITPIKHRDRTDMSILTEADGIVNNRSEEADRQYGPFSEGMERAAMIMSGMTGMPITAEHMYKALIALKLSRESYKHKRDNLLDAAAYIQGLENYINERS